MIGVNKCWTTWNDDGDIDGRCEYVQNCTCKRDKTNSDVRVMCTNTDSMHIISLFVMRALFFSLPSIQILKRIWRVWWIIMVYFEWFAIDVNGYSGRLSTRHLRSSSSLCCASLANPNHFFPICRTEGPRSKPIWYPPCEGCLWPERPYRKIFTFGLNDARNIKCYGSEDMYHAWRAEMVLCQVHFCGIRTHSCALHHYFILCVWLSVRLCVFQFLVCRLYSFCTKPTG